MPCDICHRESEGRLCGPCREAVGRVLRVVEELLINPQPRKSLPDNLPIDSKYGAALATAAGNAKWPEHY